MHDPDTRIDKGCSHFFRVEEVRRFLSLETETNFHFDTACPVTIAGLIRTAFDRFTDRR